METSPTALTLLRVVHLPGQPSTRGVVVRQYVERHVPGTRQVVQVPHYAVLWADGSRSPVRRGGWLVDSTTPLRVVSVSRARWRCLAMLHDHEAAALTRKSLDIISTSGADHAV
jgi:hypothetical protein